MSSRPAGQVTASQTAGALSPAPAGSAPGEGAGV